MPNYTKLKLNSISASPETDKQQNNKTKCCLLFAAQKICIPLGTTLDGFK